MMIRSKKASSAIIFPEGLASTYSKIAYAALGWTGVYIVDAAVVTTLLGKLISVVLAFVELKNKTICYSFYTGACVSYQMGFAQLMAQIPNFVFSSYNISTQTTLFVFLNGFVVAPFLFVRDISVLSRVSLGGLIALVLGKFKLLIYY